jgi:hypothetical protein
MKPLENYAMFLRKPTSIRLLAKALKAEAAADAALAFVTEARAKAMRQRFLAVRVEAGEVADRLEQKADIDKLLNREAKQAYHSALNEQSRVKSDLLVAEKSVMRALQRWESCEKEFDLALVAAKVARGEVPKAEGTE